MEGQWDTTVSSLQDIYNAQEQLSLDAIYSKAQVQELTTESELVELREKVGQHHEHLLKNQRIIDTLIENTDNVFRQLSQSDKGPSKGTAALHKITSSKNQKKGKSFYQSIYNPTEPIVPGSEVAYKLRQRGQELEWIQCEVTKIVSEIKFEVRDPEPDENNNPGQTYKATWKDIILLPPEDELASLINYPYGTKVLLRYPETTTFYPAEVIGTKRDGRCRLRFEGEEEEDKESEVERRLVVPYPK